jgi:predicted metal-dependent RNase
VESSVKLTFFGGVNKVGGNKVLLEDNEYKVKLFIDFGINSAELEFSTTEFKGSVYLF